MATAKERAASKGWAAVTNRRAASAASKLAASESAAAAAKAGSWKGLLQAGNVGGMLKKPGGMLGAIFLAQLLAGHLMNKAKGGLQQGLQQDLIGQQAGMSEEDAYYQAALPGLTQERQATQEALMQAIMGGGQQVQVPGERRI